MSVMLSLIGNPAIVSLIGGSILGLFSRFTIPKFVGDFAAIYLIFTVGFKGGACLGVVSECTPPLIALACVGILIGFIQPFFHYFILNETTQLDSDTKAVIASQYGSISIITFVTAQAFLIEHHVAYDSFMSFIAGIMEIPAIFSGLLIMQFSTGKTERHILRSLFAISKDIIASKKINMIFVGFFCGYLYKIFNLVLVGEFLLLPFDLFLILFMLDIGIKIGHQRSHFSEFSGSVLAFGIVLPLINGILGLAIASQFATSSGSILLFTILLASASYIAVPAIMSVYSKNAKQAIYLPLALAVTLPFNVLVGIPLFYSIITNSYNEQTGRWHLIWTESAPRAT